MTVTKRLICLLLIISFLILSACKDGEGNNDNSSHIQNNSSINSFASSCDSDDSVITEITSQSSDDSSFESISSDETNDYTSECDSSSDDDSGNNSIDNSSNDDTSSYDSTSDVSEDVDNELFCYKVLSPKLDYDLSWQDGDLKLYNTDFKMSDELQSKLEKCFDNYPLKQSVMLIELETGMTFSFKENQKIATASSIKGPFALFVYKAIESGLLDWDSEIVYTRSHYQANSTGKVQNSSFGTAFSVKTLMDYMVRISDNQAYLMFKSTLGRDKFQLMMDSLGCSEIIEPGSNWGYITAKEMAATWREIYYYSLYNDAGAELFDRFMHAQYNYIWRAIPQYEAAHKSGWSGKAFNDAGVVFADGHEYVLVVLCGRNGVYDDNAHYQFNKTTKLLAELMVEYNAYLDGEDVGNDTFDSADNDSSIDVSVDVSSDIDSFEYSSVEISGISESEDNKSE